MFFSFFFIIPSFFFLVSEFLAVDELNQSPEEAGTFYMFPTFPSLHFSAHVFIPLLA